MRSELRVWCFVNAKLRVMKHAAVTIAASVVVSVSVLPPPLNGEL